MVTVTLQEAKAKLNKLVDLAQAGEDVVLLRGSKVVATLQPLSPADLEIAPRLTDRQAKRFWQEASKGQTKTFRSAKEAVESLKRLR